MRYRCTCHFVPPVVLEELAGADVAEAKLARASLVQSMRARDKRAKKGAEAIQIGGAAAAEAGLEAGSARREVYDSKQTWQQRGTLVRAEKDPESSDSAVNNAFDYAGVVCEYFKTVLGRNSINNAGMDLIMTVHYGVNYMNAFWDGDEMTFGDGDGKIFVNFARSLDVVAHEFAHGITQSTAGLEYYSQSGALSEHFSDVFGAAVTQWHENQTAGTADWLIGDEIMGPNLYGEALRSMSSPGTAYDNKWLGKDPQPAHMRDYYTGTADNRGVHINSGIPNRAFYRTAVEIGTDNAVLIWYEALSKLWPTAKFNDAVNILVQSARALTRDRRVPLGSTQAVRSAFKSVGLPSK